MNSDHIKKILKLVSYINTHKNKFEPATQRTPYYHMGATITDAILQAGLNYKNVVYPRILTLLTQYSDYRTTSDFIILIQTIPLTRLIKWKNEIKIKRIMALTWFFYNNEIENEIKLALWLNDPSNIKDLSRIKGIGPKTIDYLKMLSGNQTIAIDRHLFKFLEIAGILVKTYEEAQLIFCKAADILDMSPYILDKKNLDIHV